MNITKKLVPICTRSLDYMFCISLNLHQFASNPNKIFWMRCSVFPHFADVTIQDQTAVDSSVQLNLYSICYIQKCLSGVSNQIFFSVPFAYFIQFEMTKMICIAQKYMPIAASGYLTKLKRLPQQQVTVVEI